MGMGNSPGTPHRDRTQPRGAVSRWRIQTVAISPFNRGSIPRRPIRRKTLPPPSADQRPHGPDHPPGHLQGLDGVLSRMETGGRQVLGDVKGHLSVAPEGPRILAQASDLPLERAGKAPLVLLQSLAHIVDRRHGDAEASEEGLEAKLDDLLRLPDHIGMGFLFQKNLNRHQALPAPIEIVPR